MPARTESSSTSRTGAAGRDGGARHDLWQDQEPDGDGDRREESEDAQDPKHATSVETANVARPGRGRADRIGHPGTNRRTRAVSLGSGTSAEGRTEVPPRDGDGHVAAGCYNPSLPPPRARGPHPDREEPLLEEGAASVQ